MSNLEESEAAQAVKKAAINNKKFFTFTSFKNELQASKGYQTLKPAITTTFIKNLSNDISIAQENLKNIENSPDLPFISEYPKNSCEIISALLSLALERKYPSLSTKVVKGYNREKNQWHYWIEIDTLVVDATAHQFSEFNAPLICSHPSPLASKFPDLEYLSPSSAIQQFPKIPGSSIQDALIKILHKT